MFFGTVRTCELTELQQKSTEIIYITKNVLYIDLTVLMDDYNWPTDPELKINSFREFMLLKA